MSFVLADEIYSQTITQQGVRIQWLKVVEAVVISGKSSGQNLPFTRTRNQKPGRPHHAALYRARNIVEHFFSRLKQFRAVATRYDKRAASYLVTALLASNVLCS